VQSYTLFFTRTKISAFFETGHQKAFPKGVGGAASIPIIRYFLAINEAMNWPFRNKGVLLQQKKEE
jgi:hypothetical protein